MELVDAGEEHEDLQATLMFFLSLWIATWGVAGGTAAARIGSHYVTVQVEFREITWDERMRAQAKWN